MREDTGRRNGSRRHRQLFTIPVFALVAVGAAAIALFLHSSAPPVTYAAQFSAQNSYKTSKYTAATLIAPTALTLTPSGKSVKLAWTTSTTTVKTGQSAAFYDISKATSSKTTCSSTTPTKWTDFTAASTAPTKTAATVTDKTRATGTGTVKAGDYVCYRVASIVGTSWGTGLYGSAQVGFVATTLTLTGKTSKITNTAEVIVTFNQKITKPTTTTWHVCVTTTKTYAVYLGETTETKSATCTEAKLTATGYKFGRLESTVAPTKTGYFKTVTLTLTNTTKTGTFKFKGDTTATKPPFTGTPTWTFIPSVTLKSKTGAVAACTTNTHKTALCEPTKAAKKF